MSFQKEAGVSEVQAARMTLGRLNTLAEVGKDIAFETTLARQLLLARIRRMQARGYLFHSEEVVRRRYERGLENFFGAYAAPANSWILYNNTSRPATVVASREGDRPMTVVDDGIWRQLSSRYMKPRVEEEMMSASSEPSWTVDDITAAVNRAVTAALRRHKQRGESIVQWRDGRIVTIKPEDIEV